jgi:transposase
MSLHAQATYEVPEETARIARAVFPKGNASLQLYDTFGTLFEDEEFSALFPNNGQPALSPVRLSLVLILQFAEGLSDRQAADAVRSRIDWKYLLCLELGDPGFDYSVLSEFRTRLIEGNAERLIFDKLLAHFRDKGLLKKRGQQRSDSTHVLGMIRSLNRIELVGETLRHALNILAVAVPEWMLAHSQPEWIDRYGPRVSDYRLPKSKAERAVYVEQVGADGLSLLNAIWSASGLEWLRELPAVQTLWKVWLQNYTWHENGRLRWRETKELPPASIAIRSPYDCEAHFAKKRSTSWVGYKVHVTETCDDDIPRLITHVETTAATTNDVVVTDTIHGALEARDCLPAQHIVDRGYVDAERLVTSQEVHGVDLIGPTRDDTGWQARQGKGFAAQDFIIDWENQLAICPAGTKSIHWMPAINNKGKPVIQIKFSKRDCRVCASQPDCTRANPPRRSITVSPEDQYKALLAAREREKTEAFSELYARRAGVEGTISQGVRRCGLRRTRYVGLAKTHLQHLLTAMAINIVRVLQWMAGDQPAQTRQSAFVRLHTAAALAP